MKYKQFIGAEEGDVIAAFVSRIEEKTGKTLKQVHARLVAHEPALYALTDVSSQNPETTEIVLNVSVEFFPTPASNIGT